MPFSHPRNAGPRARGDVGPHPQTHLGQRKEGRGHDEYLYVFCLF